MRLFVAVDIPPGLREAIDAKVCAPLEDELPHARWTRPEGRHLTLRFLGEVPDDAVEAVGDALREAASSNAPFRASFATVGAFPTLRRPRVLWVGVGEGHEEMAALAGSVSACLEPLGFEPEDRAFKGHLTLCRFKVPERIGDLPDVEVPGEAFEVREIVLFRSQLHPEGARYTPLARIPLDG